MWNDWLTSINNIFIPYCGLFPPSHCKYRALFLHLITLSDIHRHDSSGRVISPTKGPLPTPHKIFARKTFMFDRIFLKYFYSGTLRTFQHTWNRYCQHHSWSQSVHWTRDIITPPHHRAFRSTSLPYTIPVHLAYISLPLTSHCTRVQGWHTLRPMHNTESHPFLHLMGQGTLMLVCLHASAVHAAYSHGSISVPLLPLPKHCNKIHPDAAAPRRVPLVGSWS